jgi:type I restriction enzyme S subunit
MAGEWKETTLGECAAWLSGGTPFKGNEAFWFGPIPWVSAKDMKSFRLDDAEDHISPLAVGNGGKLVPAGTILLLVRGMTLHNDVPICMVTREMAFNQDIKALRPAKNVDGAFLAYWLLANKPKLLASVDHAGHGTGRLVTDTLKEKPVLLPPLAEQKAIAAVLGALDDKIELNRRMNATLEAMARALFQSWFVDFDPVRAKQEGRKPTGMDDATAALFPDSFRESDVGEIPEGWDVLSLDKTAQYLNGLALQKYPPGDGPTLPVIKIAQLRKGDSCGADRCNTELPPEYIVQDGDVLFSWSGSLEVELWCGGLGALNQHLFKVTSSEFPKWFYLLWTLHHLSEFRLIAAAKATTMGHIQRGHLTAAKALIPPRPLLLAMTGVMSPLIDQIITNRTQSRTLATLRDTLLPKLLSGEVSVLQGGLTQTL